MGTRKADLQRIVDDQQMKIDKYERKLRDVIGAYKSLAAEKTALEESMKALNVSEDANGSQQQESAIEDEREPKEDNGTENGEARMGKADEDACERASVGSSVDTSFSENASSVEAFAKSTLPLPSDSGSKIAVLRRALATITEEKSRQEKAFTGDRKNLLQEIASLKEDLKEQQMEATKAEAVLKQQIQELKANLRQMQCERECEQTDHGAMLKEMQEKLSQTRTQCESYQKQIFTLSADLKKKEQEPEESRRLIEQLLEENIRLKEQLDEAEKKLMEMPQVSRMQMELHQIKAQHAAAIQEEQARSSHALDELARFKEQSESQNASLEARIAELTTTLSEYERLRRQDLDNIEKLSFRVNELDQENTTLAKVTACRSCAGHSKDDSMQSMLEKLKNLFSDLRRRYDAPDYSGPIVDFYEFLSLENPNSEQMHSQCRNEYDSLKDEFEKYKLRAKTAFKNKNLIKDTASTEKRELDQLRSIVNDLQRSLAESQHQCESTEATCVELRRSIAQLKEERRRELVEVQSQFKQQIADVEAESNKQRERSLDVLAEKDKELETMRVILRAIRSSSPYGHSSADNPNSLPSLSRKHSSPANRSNLKSSSGSQQEISVTVLERRGSSESVHSAGCDSYVSPHADSGDPTSASIVPNMHLSQELARKEKAIEQLRKDIRQLETTSRELQRASLTKELQHYDTIEKLKEEIRSLESKLSRYQITGESFEYLKNVLVQYMTCDDAAGKAHMLKAIGRALHLTVKELDSIQKHNARFYSWWPGGKVK